MVADFVGAGVGAFTGLTVGNLVGKEVVTPFVGPRVESEDGFVVADRLVGCNVGMYWWLQIGSLS